MFILVVSLVYTSIRPIVTIVVVVDVVITPPSSFSESIWFLPLGLFTIPSHLLCPSLPSLGRYNRRSSVFHSALYMIILFDTLISSAHHQSHSPSSFLSSSMFTCQTTSLHYPSSRIRQCTLLQPPAHSFPITTIRDIIPRK